MFQLHVSIIEKSISSLQIGFHVQLKDFKIIQNMKAGVCFSKPPKTFHAQKAILCAGYLPREQKFNLRLFES